MIGQSIGFASPPTNQQSFKFGRSQEERAGTQNSGSFVDHSLPAMHNQFNSASMQPVEYQSLM